LFRFLGRFHGVELIQIEVIRLQALQRTFELGTRALGIALFRLTCQKDIFAVRLKCNPEFLFRFTIAVRRRNVKVV
jgi:hypothetical protein